jgi:hypothetical protein
VRTRRGISAESITQERAMSYEYYATHDYDDN